jgi:hypothetical protein
MLPIIKLSQTWLESLGWSYSDAASLFEIDLAAAVPAGTGDRCPRCTRDHSDYQGQVFVPDPATETPERIYGRAYVLCLCKRMYWYSAVHAVAAADVRPTVPAADVKAQPDDPYYAYHRWYRPNPALYFFTPAPPPESAP